MMNKTAARIVAAILICFLLGIFIGAGLLYSQPVRLEYAFADLGTGYKVTGFKMRPSVTSFDLVIPETCKGRSVTGIAPSAFYNCTVLTSVAIPSSVTSIGEGAFQACTSLISLTIPDSVKSIGSFAFYGCSSLASITIPESVTSISRFAFSDCSSLTSIIIPESVTSIGEYAFSQCTALTIYCRAARKPSGWDSDWNPGNCHVVWGYTGQ